MRAVCVATGFRVTPVAPLSQKCVLYDVLQYLKIHYFIVFSNIIAFPFAKPLAFRTSASFSSCLCLLLACLIG